MKPVISVKNLYKLYHVGDSVVRALDGVSFEVYEGEFCAIVGTSGSGKSTLLNMLAGLEKPTRGEVVISGQHIESLKEDELVRFRRANICSTEQQLRICRQNSGRVCAVRRSALCFSSSGC